jgi:hypothetical protein
MNIVEIHTESGSQYTITEYGDLTTLHVVRTEGHPLGEYSFHTLTDWTLQVMAGRLVGFFRLEPVNGQPDSLRTSVITTVRQQNVKGAFV